MSRLRIAVLTTGRQDWGILRSTCAALRDDADFDLRLLVGGMHCSQRHGATAGLIRQDGFSTEETLPWLADGEADAAATDREAADALSAVAGALRRQQPRALLLVGDRLETVTAAIAATLGRVPLVHLHGGEETEGAFDNAFRNAITKMSHLHLVSHALYRDRVIAMGEDPASVHVVGAPGLDNLRRADLADRAELESVLERKLEPPVVVMTLHPATWGEDPLTEVGAVVAAMDQVQATYVVTLPNSDPGNQVIRSALTRAAVGPRRVAVEALGERRFWGLLRVADAMLGNSSSGLIEAPALRLPTVNVGDRQRGRLRAASVVDVGPSAAAIASALRQALSPEFRRALEQSAAPFGEGRAAEKIVSILRGWTPPDPPRKRSVFS